MKFAFLGNYTIDLIAKEFEKKEKDEIFISGYNQYYLDLLDKNSDYLRFKPDLTTIILDGNSLLETKSHAEIKSHIDELVKLFEENSNGYLILANIFFDQAIDSIKNYNDKNSIKNLQSEINNYLLDLTQKNNRIFILDILSIFEQNGVKNIYDNSMWQFAKIRFNKNGHQLIADELSYLKHAILNQTKKCLVLDLDNTLWGGIIGEDGMSGIALGAEGVGECFVKFQKNIKKISEKGILLCLCSKNNLDDAKEVFDKHEFSHLKWNDFILHKVSWNLKSQSIAEIAETLNIGQDSLVFIDDNPAEREIVARNTAAVVPDFPTNPEDLENFIKEIDKKYFAKLVVTKEDLEKNEQYKQNSQREIIKQSSANLDEFIKNLEIKITIEKAKKDNVARISQLTQKTNQFNFTTKRYSEIEIENMMNDKNFHIFSAKVEDKFGNYGTVILAIIKQISSEKYEIDTFLMSCRVIGKEVEKYFLNFVINLLKPSELTAHYIPTAKNILVQNKYDELGFTLNAKQDKIKIYKFNSLNCKDNKIYVEYEK